MFLMIALTALLFSEVEFSSLYSNCVVLTTGKDKYVVLWSIQDHISTLINDASKSAVSSGSIVKAADNPSVGPRGIFQGHQDTVEDVQFCPSK